MSVPGSENLHTDKARILIVDDMQVNRTILSSMLSEHGITCDLAESGEKCLEMCQKGSYDMIILDHHMPDLDGVDTLVILKDSFRRSGIETPVICHTTAEGRGYANLYLAAGFSDILIKPVEEEELADLISKYLPDGGFKALKDDEKKKQNERELASLPDWLKQVTKLDLMSGIEHCNTAFDYLDALMIFAGSIEDKAADIERFEKDENWPMYLLRVHSLKSIARLIGASTVADRAADLEYAGNQEEYGLLHAGTEALLYEYRSMLPELRRLFTEGTSKDGNNKSSEHREKKEPPAQTLLFVSDDHGLVGKGIINSLEREGFKVIEVGEIPEIILNHRGDAKLLLYYPTGSSDHIRQLSTMLAEMCHDDKKTLCLTGEPADIDAALDIHDRDYISSVYPRPVDLDRMAADMCEYYDSQAEYMRTKKILVIDDDPDFLTIIKNWLSEDYEVECLRSGASALKYLEEKRPDLILLDYEMPGMNGEQVMLRIRNNPKSERIPIIFLTGKNEKEDVIRVLEKKPDGYLLKSMPHEELLASLDRFFAGTILSGD